MKKILFFATAAAVLAAGCAGNDEAVDVVGGQTVTITASRAADSRIAVSDNDAILWQAEDALGVYLGEAAYNKKFSLKSGAGSTAASFEATNTSLPNAACNVYAYCPYAVSDVPAPTAVAFDLKSQSYGAFGEYWLMAGIAENVGFPAETSFAMQMHNMMSALRVKMTNRNAADITINQLEIYTASAGDKTFVATGTIDITDPEFAITPATYTHKVSLDLTEGVVIPAGETRILPIVIAPTEGLDGKTFYIKYRFEGDTEPSVDTKQGKSIVRNKFIDIPINIGTITITVPETVATVDKANEALENGATDVVITEAPTEDQTIVIPHNYTDSETKVSVELPAVPEGVALTIAYGDATDNAPKSIAVKTADKAVVDNLVIDAPESTVTVNGEYTSMTASTADNTLVVTNATKIGSLTVRKGNVEIYGTVGSVDRTESPASKVHFTVNSVEKWNKAAACSAASTITIVGSLDLKLASDIVTAAADELAQIIVEKGSTLNLDLAGHRIESKNAGVSIWNYGTMTIDDTVGGGAVFNTQSIPGSNNYFHHAMCNSGSLTINGGRFGDPDSDTENANTEQRGAALRTHAGSTTVVNGGSFTAGDNYFTWGETTGFTYAIRNGGEMTINDASLYGAMNGGVSCEGGTGAVAYIKGGNFSLTGPQSWYVLVTGTNTKMYISGGTFIKIGGSQSCNGMIGGYQGMPSWDASQDLENNGYYITGGTFTKDGETVTF